MNTRGLICRILKSGSYNEAPMKFELQKIDNSVLNWHGYRIVREDGSVMAPIRTKAEGEKLINFFCPPTKEPDEGAKR